MKLDVSKIVKSDGASLKISQELSLEKISFNGQDFVFVAPLKVEGTIKNNGGNLYLDVDVHAVFTAYCARCLKELCESFDFSVSECFTNSEIGEDSTMLPIISNTVDLQSAVEDNFCTSVPFVFLCDDDCKGLCHMCGKDLNEGECDCEDEEIDPRLAGLKAFLKND